MGKLWSRENLFAIVVTKDDAAMKAIFIVTKEVTHLFIV